MTFWSCPFHEDDLEKRFELVTVSSQIKNSITNGVRMRLCIRTVANTS